MAPKPHFILIIMIFSFFTGCSKSHKSPSEFAIAYTKELKAKIKGVEIRQKAELELEIELNKGAKTTVFLNNAYDSYKSSPKDEDSIIQKYVAGNIEALASNASTINKDYIIPVIKDTAWINKIRQIALAKGGKAPEQVTEPFCEGLTIVYAEDSPNNIKYFSESDLAKIHLQKPELKEIAIANLKKNLPKIEVHGGNGTYMLTAGGVYESSILLFNKIWNDKNFQVSGDIVVCVPARDMLLVTGSNDHAGLGKIKEIAKQVLSESPYRLTDKLYVRKNGSFEPFLQN